MPGTRFGILVFYVILLSVTYIHQLSMIYFAENTVGKFSNNIVLTYYQRDVDFSIVQHFVKVQLNKWRQKGKGKLING